MLKVSVVIPTYKSPPKRLEGLVASLDRQTMSTEDFEVFFIDDGSPDDTWERLQQIKSTRANVRTERIENSGWPSRARNIGIERGRGEYVVFMDHDDQLYPEALETAYAFARHHNADVVNAKEVRTRKPYWGLNVFDRDLAQSIGRHDKHPLSPMNPHKLYRRALLLENGIRFPEGGRVLWEDQFFNIQVARHATTISLLSSVPFYHWVTTQGSGSTGFLRKSPSYWQFLRAVCRTTEEELAGEEFAQQREQLLTHQYATRILGSFNAKFTKRAAPERSLIFGESRAIQSAFDLQRFDHSLNASRRIRAHLLRTGRQDLMELTCRTDRPAALHGVTHGLRWESGLLHVQASVQWLAGDGSPQTMLRTGDRLLKPVPDTVADAVPIAARDVTDEVAEARVQMLVHSRKSQVPWMLPSQHELRLENGANSTVVLEGTVTATLDMETAAMGRPLEAGTVWDLFVHSDIGGAVAHRALRSDLSPAASLIDGRLCLAFSNAKNHVSVIVEGQDEAVRRLTPQAAALDPAGRLIVTLSGEHDGAGEVATKVGVRPGPRGPFTEVPATIRVQDGHAELIVNLDTPHTRIRVGDRDNAGPVDWGVAVTGTEVSIQRGRERSRSTTPKPVVDESTGRRLRRWGGRVLRRWGLRIRR